jgi:coenzyme PQQ precursor peptide PqqA
MCGRPSTALVEGPGYALFYEGYPASPGNTAERPDHNGLTPTKRNTAMAWTTPTLVEICIGLEINGYLPAEF